MERSLLDTRQLVERLWQKAASQPAPHISAATDELEPLAEMEELSYINRHYSLPFSYQAPGGLLTRMKRILRRLAGRAVFGVLHGYLLEERDFLANLVRLQNELSLRIDRLSTEVGSLAMATSDAHRLVEQSEILHRLLERRIESLEQQIGKG